jgi:hypothetical protein
VAALVISRRPRSSVIIPPVKVRFDGPEGMVNREIATHLREVAGPLGEDDEPIGDFLDPGAVYDLPTELAKRAVASNEFFSFVSNYSDLNKKELLSIAESLGVEGRSTMDKPALVAAIREKEGSS